VSYDGIGRLSGITLGNGVTEGFGYDSNRMQLISQTATKNGGPTNGLMNLTYGYDATAGQMGAGSTAGTAGQLISISGTINQTTESAAYTYDDLGRLVTSNQTSNGSSAQRRFAYDRWGNRTGMWDAVNGGTQVQSIALQQSGGAPTNQIQSVTSGSTVNYTYDSAGNVTNDGAHSYTYDSENRIVSVDGGSTAAYAYDQLNQRYKKTIGSTVTHYIWKDSQVIAEHNGSTGAPTADYVYSGSRMMAKAAGLTTQYFLSDRLSERMMLNTSGTVIGRQGHLPFGEDFAESGTQEKHHLAGDERDSEAGTDYAVNRQNAQSLGRFAQPDPHGPRMNNPVVLGSYGDPQSLNRYSYARNDPIDLADPQGLDFCGGYWVYDGDENLIGFLVTDCDPGNDTKTSSGPNNGATRGGGSSPQPTYDKKKRQCDEKLASMFGGPGAVAAGNGFDVHPDGSRYWRGSGTDSHLDHYMHLYGSADLTVDGTVYVPDGFDSKQWLGGDFGTAAFHYANLNGMTDVTLVVRHLKSLDIGSPQGGRVSIGEMGGLDGDGPDGPNYQHAHLELYQGNWVSSGGPPKNQRKSKWISFSDAFCTN
jgi:RHS repeat-associated protein